MRLTIKIGFISSAFLILSCGVFEKDNQDNAPGSDSKFCMDQKSEIIASMGELNHCEVSSDCTHESVNSRFGCGMVFNINEDPTTVLNRIDSYSNSSCWDGLTTLTLSLACTSISDGSLECRQQKCFESVE